MLKHKDFDCTKQAWVPTPFLPSPGTQPFYGENTHLLLSSKILWGKMYNKHFERSDLEPFMPSSMCCNYRGVGSVPLRAQKWEQGFLHHFEPFFISSHQLPPLREGHTTHLGHSAVTSPACFPGPAVRCERAHISCALLLLPVFTCPCCFPSLKRCISLPSKVEPTAALTARPFSCRRL